LEEESGNLITRLSLYSIGVAARRNVIIQTSCKSNNADTILIKHVKTADLLLGRTKEL
jgi:hypothetical protein